MRVSGGTVNLKFDKQANVWVGADPDSDHLMLHGWGGRDGNRASVTPEGLHLFVQNMLDRKNKVVIE